MSEMSILIVALLGLAGGLFVHKRFGSGSGLAKARYEAEVAHEKRVEKARDAHAEVLDKIEEDRANDRGGDPSDALNKMADRGEISK